LSLAEHETAFVVAVAVVVVVVCLFAWLGAAS
jgi:hypothetical protein